MGQRQNRVLRLHRNRLDRGRGPPSEWREVASQTRPRWYRLRIKRHQERSSELLGGWRLRLFARRWQIELRTGKHCGVILHSSPMAGNLPSRWPALYRQPRLQSRPWPGGRAFVPRPRRVLEGFATNPYFEEDNLPGSIYARLDCLKIFGAMQE